MGTEIRFQIARAFAVAGLFCAILGASLFYGMFIGAVAAKYMFHLSDGQAMLFGFIPVTAISCVLMGHNWRKLAKAMKVERWLID
jgi:hypothetical protein